MMVVFALHNAKKHCLGSRVAPKTPIPLYPVGQQRFFCILGMGLFALDNAKKHCLDYGLAPQTPIPRYSIGQQSCFWIPMMAVFALHNAKKIVSIMGGRSKHPYLCTP